jgi:hypothetical protein
VRKSQSRAELALGDMCRELGYCLPPDEQDAILMNPPQDAEAFVDAVLIAEGRNPDLILRQDRRPLLDIVNRWAVYDADPVKPSVANRPRFPSN